MPASATRLYCVFALCEDENFDLLYAARDRVWIGFARGSAPPRLQQGNSRLLRPVFTPVLVHGRDKARAMVEKLLGFFARRRVHAALGWYVIRTRAEWEALRLVTAALAAQPLLTALLREPVERILVAGDAAALEYLRQSCDAYVV